MPRRISVLILCQFCTIVIHICHMHSGYIQDVALPLSCLRCKSGRYQSCWACYTLPFGTIFQHEGMTLVHSTCISPLHHVQIYQRFKSFYQATWLTSSPWASCLDHFSLLWQPSKPCTGIGSIDAVRFSGRSGGIWFNNMNRCCISFGGIIYIGFDNNPQQLPWIFFRGSTWLQITR